MYDFGICGTKRNVRIIEVSVRRGQTVPPLWQRECAELLYFNNKNAFLEPFGLKALWV